MSNSLLRRAGGSIVALVLVAGCAGPATSTEERGLLMATSGGRELTLPTGVERAVIYEIDGVRVALGQRSVQVSPGQHIVRATPVVAGPVHQVPSAEWLATRLDSRPVTVDVVAGRRYMIGVRWLEPLDYPRAAGAYEAVAFASGALSEGVLSQDPP